MALWKTLLGTSRKFESVSAVAKLLKRRNGPFSTPFVDRWRSSTGRPGLEFHGESEWAPPEYHPIHSSIPVERLLVQLVERLFLT